MGNACYDKLRCYRCFSVQLKIAGQRVIFVLLRKLTFSKKITSFSDVRYRYERDKYNPLQHHGAFIINVIGGFLFTPDSRFFLLDGLRPT